MYMSQIKQIMLTNQHSSGAAFPHGLVSSPIIDHQQQPKYPTRSQELQGTLDTVFGRKPGLLEVLKTSIIIFTQI